MFEFFSTITPYLPRFQDILDILIVAYIFYKILSFFYETRAGSLINGIMLLLLFLGVSKALQLNTINFLLSSLLQVALLAFVIIFQPELRGLLERVGRTKLSTLFSQGDTSSAEKVATEVAAAAVAMSSRRIGALIVLERNTKIGDIVRTGCEIDSTVSSELLINIFIPNTPLHDGAVIIRENRILAARCILPLTQNETLSQEFGTRHRAALGLSECSDAAIIVISEETGKISFTLNGDMSRNFTEETLKKVIMKVLSSDSGKNSENTISKWKERLRWKK